MVALLVFIIATLETVFVVFSRQTLLDAKGPFGDDVFKNPVRTTRAIMALANYHHLGLLYQRRPGLRRANFVSKLFPKQVASHVVLRKSCGFCGDLLPHFWYPEPVVSSSRGLERVKEFGRVFGREKVFVMVWWQIKRENKDFQQPYLLIWNGKIWVYFNGNYTLHLINMDHLVAEWNQL